MKPNCLKKSDRAAQSACGLAPALLLVLVLVASLSIPAAGQQPPGPQPSPAQQPPSLKQVVVLSRHGVRTATQTGNDNQAVKAWPVWVEPTNFLTPTGGLLMQAMGQAYSNKYQTLLFGSAPCPPAGSVYVWSDSVERDVQTAQSVLKGFTPAKCAAIPVNFMVSGKTDPLFHSIGADAKDYPAPGSVKGVPPTSQGQGAAAVVATIAARGPSSSASLPSIMQGLGDTNSTAEFNAMETPLGCTPGCLTNLPIVITSATDGSTSQSGALATASSASEAFMLEYGDGWSPNDIAWGKLGSDQAAIQANLKLVLNLHVDAYKLVQRNPVVGAMQASNLANEIVQIFNRAAKVTGPCPQSQGPCSPCPQNVAEGAELCPPANAPLVFLVGHDTNIGTLGGMLAMDWDLSAAGLPADDMPPGGALVFELWQLPQMSPPWYVVVNFITPTIQGFGNAQACASNPTRCVGVAPVTFAGASGCNALNKANYCTLAQFQAWVQKQSNPYFTFADWAPKNVPRR